MNARIATMIAITMTVITALFMAQGCDLRSMTKLEVPPDIKGLIAQGPEDVDREYTLAEVDFVVTEWRSYVDRNNGYILAAVKDAEERYALAGSLIDLGVGIGTEAASTLPGGAIIVSGLTLLTGLFMKRPGEDKRVSKEKEDSYNAGLEEGRRLAEAVKAELGKAQESNS